MLIIPPSVSTILSTLTTFPGYSITSNSLFEEKFTCFVVILQIKQIFCLHAYIRMGFETVYKFSTHYLVIEYTFFLSI